MQYGSQVFAKDKTKKVMWAKLPDCQTANDHNACEEERQVVKNYSNTLNFCLADQKNLTIILFENCQSSRFYKILTKRASSLIFIYADRLTFSYGKLNNS